MVPKEGQPHYFALAQKKVLSLYYLTITQNLTLPLPTFDDYTEKVEYGPFRPFQDGKWGKKQATLCEIQGAIKEQASPPWLAL